MCVEAVRRAADGSGMCVHLLRWNMHRWKVAVRRMVSHSTMRAKRWALFIVGFLSHRVLLKLFDGDLSVGQLFYTVVDRHGNLFPKMGIYYGEN